MNDARGLAVTSASAECVAALDRTAESYLGFRADMGAQVNAAVEADPGAPLPHVMKGYLGMLLSNANALGLVDDCLHAARAAAQGLEREQLHLRALGACRASVAPCKMRSTIQGLSRFSRRRATCLTLLAGRSRFRMGTNN